MKGKFFFGQFPTNGYFYLLTFNSRKDVVTRYTFNKVR